MTIVYCVPRPLADGSPYLAITFGTLRLDLGHVVGAMSICSIVSYASHDLHDVTCHMGCRCLSHEDVSLVLSRVRSHGP